MKYITALLTILFISSLSSPSWSEPVNMNDLVERNERWYQKFTDVPFNGEVSGLTNGTIKNGKRNGVWKTYWKNGQLQFLSSYRNGIDHGIFEDCSEDGKLKFRHSYKNGLSEGISEHYFSNGKIWLRDNYKHCRRHGVSKTYHEKLYHVQHTEVETLG